MHWNYDVVHNQDDTHCSRESQLDNDGHDCSKISDNAAFRLGIHDILHFRCPQDRKTKKLFSLKVQVCDLVLL